MSETGAGAARRWWEVAALRAGLELPAGVGSVPGWIFTDAEARRLSVGLGVRRVGVGAAFTGQVLLDALAGDLPGEPAAMGRILGEAMEGPLWLDIGPEGAFLEGAIFSPRGSAAEWLADVRDPAEALLGPVDVEGMILRAERALPSPRVGGARVCISAPGVEVILQQPLGPGVEPRAVLEGLQEIAGDQGVGEGAEAILTQTFEALGGPGAALMDVILSGHRRGLTLRFWNITLEGARSYCAAAGASAEALARLEALLTHARCPDVARAGLVMRPGAAPGVRLLVDMGLAEF